MKGLQELNKIKKKIKKKYSKLFHYILIFLINGSVYVAALFLNQFEIQNLQVFRK